jgi:hypothetical protein
MDVWECPIQITPFPKTTVASVVLEADPGQTSLIGNSQCSNGDGKPCPEIGYATHLNRASMRPHGMPITINTKITGPINYKLGNGWYIRYFAGAPKSFQIKSIQLQSPNTTLIMVFPYPEDTSFTIKAHAASWCNPGKITCEYTFTKVHCPPNWNLYT